MLAWTISLIQILAILACPLTCVSGHTCCGAGVIETGPFQAASRTTLPSLSEAFQLEEANCNCCCDTDAQHSSDDSPAAPTSHTVCQGVCGGAILEKSCDLPVDTSFTTLPAVIVGVGTLAFSDVELVDNSFCLYGSGNYGRSLRTLHQSFLC